MIQNESSLFVYSYYSVNTHPMGGGPRVVVSTAASHARVRGSVPGLGGLKETKMFLPHPRVKVSIVGSLRDRDVACSASDRQGSNFESCVWRTVSSQSSHHPQEVLLAQFSLYVHKGGLKPDSFHFHLHIRSSQKNSELFHKYLTRNTVLRINRNEVHGFMEGRRNYHMSKYFFTEIFRIEAKMTTKFHWNCFRIDRVGIINEKLTSF